MQSILPDGTIPRRHVYPGVVGEYTDLAWWWAEQSCDGRITDRMLQGISRRMDLPYRSESWPRVEG